MPSVVDTINLPQFQSLQGTTEGKHLAPDDLLALRSLFLLLDTWDRNAGRTPDAESLQGRITSASQPACQTPRQGNAAPSPRRQDHPNKTR